MRRGFAATKPPVKAITLTGGSFLAGAIANKPRRCVYLIEIKVADPRRSNVLDKLVEILPSGVTLDATDTEAEKCCSLDNLAAGIPLAKATRLDPQSQQIHILTSEHHPAHHADGLIEVIGAEWRLNWLRDRPGPPWQGLRRDADQS